MNTLENNEFARVSSIQTVSLDFLDKMIGAYFYGSRWVLDSIRSVVTSTSARIYWFIFMKIRAIDYVCY